MNASNLFIIIICIVNMLGVPRYLFRWGDPASSPAYELIPDEYFLFWNSLTVILVITLIANLRKLSLLFTTCYFYLLYFSMVVIAQSKSFYVHGTGKSLILNGFIFISLASNSKWVSIKKLNKAIELLALSCSIFIFFQIIQLYIFGVLPAHSHAEFIIRFGGIYDDSLVLAIILPMFAGYYLNKFLKPIAKMIICLLCIIMSFLTGSFTGILIMLLYIVWCMRQNLSLLFGLFFVITIASVCLFEKLYNNWLFKQDSIYSHINGWDNLVQLTAPTLLGIYPTDLYPEPGYASLLLNFGAPLLFFWLRLYASYRLYAFFLLKINLLKGTYASFLGQRRV